MICFDLDGGRFNYRVVAAIVHDGHVLLHKTERDIFWALPGGRAEMNETACDTLTREMAEELGLQVRVGPLWWIVENFFTYDNARFHELALYFAVHLPDRCPQLVKAQPFRGSEPHLLFRWFPLPQLDQITLYPQFLQQGLQQPPAHPVHIIERG